MDKFRKICWSAVQCIAFLMILFAVVFVGATLLCICITSFGIHDFRLVLYRILRHIESYNILLVGIGLIVFFRIYSKEKELEKEDAARTGEVGSYTLALGDFEAGFNEKFVGEKMVVEITRDCDYSFETGTEEPYVSTPYIYFPVKFLTSKAKSSNLKNIMIFGDSYFKKHIKGILKNYYDYCERISYSSPIYCAAKPTKEERETATAIRKRYFWVVTRLQKPEETKIFWVTAVTEEGRLLFIKVKARIEGSDKERRIILLQQTTYCQANNRICPICK